MYTTNYYVRLVKYKWRPHNIGYGSSLLCNPLEACYHLGSTFWSKYLLTDGVSYRWNNNIYLCFFCSTIFSQSIITL